MPQNNFNGVVPDLVTKIRDYEYETVCGSIAGATYPEEYEIPRENTGTLKNQGDICACVAETCVQIAEEWYKRQFGTQEEHSEGFFYGANRNSNSNSSGMVPSTAMELWTKNGSIPKKMFDILIEMPDMKAILEKYPELYEEAKKYKLKGFTRLRTTGSSTKDMQIKDALTKYQYGLVAISPTGFTGGSHCIQLTGWNDKTNKYKFKNSWGKNYCDNGFSEIAKNKIEEVYLPLFEDVVLPFTDVKETDWFYKSIKNMYFAGIAQGVSETLFDPNAPLTRAQGFALADRILKEVDDRFTTLSKILQDKNEYSN